MTNTIQAEHHLDTSQEVVERRKLLANRAIDLARFFCILYPQVFANGAAGKPPLLIKMEDLIAFGRALQVPGGPAAGDSEQSEQAQLFVELVRSIEASFPQGGPANVANQRTALDRVPGLLDIAHQRIDKAAADTVQSLRAEIQRIRQAHSAGANTHASESRLVQAQTELRLLTKFSAATGLLSAAGSNKSSNPTSPG
jgi:hypothetical protein